jgi:metal-responsive CopG/Arc/MetJ family transcriptional regulator
MTGNPKSSPWYAVPLKDRVRKVVSFTLSDEAREKLEKLMKRRGEKSRSALIEALIMEAKR